MDITFQQVQKYEKGVNRIGAGRLQQIAIILKVPIPYFFEGVPISDPRGTSKADPGFGDIADFVATTQGLKLIRSFMRVKDVTLRRRIIQLVQEIAGDDD